MNRTFLLILTSFLLLFGCRTELKKSTLKNDSVQNNTLTPTEIEQGWKLLFDGKSFDGWRGLGREAVQKEHWRIEDGTIRKLNSGEVPSLADGQPTEGGDLMTIKSFDNYDLYFEWKISPAGNTGLKYNVSEEMSQKYGSKYAALGFEYQLLDDKDTIYANQKPTHYTGGLYDMIIPQNTKVKPLEEFNSSRILIDGNHVEHWLNGNMVLEYELGSKHLGSLYKKSKYADYPHFLEKRKGHIVLQNHKDDAWFRNIKVREITPNK